MPVVAVFMFKNHVPFPVFVLHYFLCIIFIFSDLDGSALGMSSSPALPEGGILSPSPDPLPPPLPNPINLRLPEHGQEEEFIPVSDH